MTNMKGVQSIYRTISWSFVRRYRRLISRTIFQLMYFELLSLGVCSVLQRNRQRVKKKVIFVDEPKICTLHAPGRLKVSPRSQKFYIYIKPFMDIFFEMGFAICITLISRVYRDSFNSCIYVCENIQVSKYIRSFNWFFRRND